MTTNPTITAFLKNTIDGLSNLTRLEVNTLVGDYTFTYSNNNPTDPASKGKRMTIDADSTTDRMCSQINLLTGDITTAMTSKFVVDYKELRDYHLAREAQGHAIIEKNIAVLEKIVAAILDFDKK